MMQNLAVSDVNRGMASDGRAKRDQNQIAKFQTVVNQSESFVSEELGIQRFVFPELIIPSIIPQLDSELPLIEIPNEGVAVGYPETKFASAVIIVQFDLTSKTEPEIQAVDTSAEEV